MIILYSKAIRLSVELWMAWVSDVEQNLELALKVALELALKPALNLAL
jgi:hypothetical protein